MTLDRAELSYNKTYCFLQFKVYEMTFGTMLNLVRSGLDNGNKSPLPFQVNDDEKIMFTIDTHSDTTRQCVLLKIEIIEEEYKELKEYCPDKEMK